MCHRLTTIFLLHSSLIHDTLVGFRPPYDSIHVGELGWVMCHEVPIFRVIMRLSYTK